MIAAAILHPFHRAVGIEVRAPPRQRREADMSNALKLSASIRKLILSTLQIDGPTAERECGLCNSVCVRCVARAADSSLPR